MTEAIEGAYARVLSTFRLLSSGTHTGYWMRAAILLGLLLVLVTAASLPVSRSTAENTIPNPVARISG